jgi:hypothetical protein
MQTKTPLVSLALWLILGAVALAGNPFMGTWKLNDAKSKFPRGATKNNTVVYQSAFTKTKIIVDGVTAKGQAIHDEWTGSFDGKDYAVTGDPDSDMRSYTKADDRTLNMTVKKGGKVTYTGKIVIAADGKTRTVTTMNAKGKKVMSIAFYDKQM